MEACADAPRTRSGISPGWLRLVGYMQKCLCLKSFVLWTGTFEKPVFFFLLFYSTPRHLLKSVVLRSSLDCGETQSKSHRFLSAHRIAQRGIRSANRFQFQGDRLRWKPRLPSPRLGVRRNAGSPGGRVHCLGPWLHEHSSYWFFMWSLVFLQRSVSSPLEWDSFVRLGQDWLVISSIQCLCGAWHIENPQ